MEFARVAQLGDNLDKACAQFDRWASEQVGAQEVFKKQHRRRTDELIAEIKHLEMREMELKREKTTLADRLHREKRELQDFQSGINKLDARRKALPDKNAKLTETIDAVQSEIHQRRESAEALQFEKSELLHEYDTDVEQYQRCLGLRLEPNGEAIRFVFHHIDPNDPDRPFYFSLRVNESHYRVDEAQPHVSDLHSLVAELNRTEDLGRFTINLRTRFLRHVVNAK